MFKKHGNGYNDHVTSNYTGKLGRIYHVRRNGYTLWTKVMRKGDIYFGYIEPGHTEILLEVEEVIL